MKVHIAERVHETGIVREVVHDFDAFTAESVVTPEARHAVEVLILETYEMEQAIQDNFDAFPKTSYVLGNVRFEW